MATETNSVPATGASTKAETPDDITFPAIAEDDLGGDNP